MKYRKSLPKKLASRYFIREHILSDEIGYVYSIADLVVSRSGANTFFELIALKIPAVLIPLPWSANGEQQRHAELFQDSGAGILFDQDDIFAESPCLYRTDYGKSQTVRRQF